MGAARRKQYIIFVCRNVLKESKLNKICWQGYETKLIHKKKGLTAYKMLMFIQMFTNRAHNMSIGQNKCRGRIIE